MKVCRYSYSSHTRGSSRGPTSLAGAPPPPPVLVPTIRGIKDNVQNGSDLMDVEWDPCIQRPRPLLNIVLDALDGRHQHLGGGAHWPCWTPMVWLTYYWHDDDPRLCSEPTAHWHVNMFWNQYIPFYLRLDFDTQLQWYNVPILPVSCQWLPICNE